MQAADLDRSIKSEQALRDIVGEPASASLPWSRPTRLLFLLMAAALCWAGPVLILYFVAS
jgi:hypothetical protein